MTEKSNGVVILITLLNILLYKLQKLQEAQQKRRLPLSVRQLCRRFSFADIKSATENFKEDLVIGKGGFGIVYKGFLDFKERIVAIKRSKAMSKQGCKEFLTEIKMLSQFQHSHLVSLIGYCDDFEEMILVYDFMPSGSLADHLHKRTRKGNSSLPSLSWVQRLKICIGAAHGLDYLHTGTGIDDRVIHRDVKTSNILLDDNLAAKISDFGLSRTGPANQTCTYVSTRVKGTHGYLDPYYVATHRLTRKSDVYAFGVVLFEVLCGRPAVDTGLDEEQIGLAGWAQHCFKEGLLEQIIDPSIKADISSDSQTTFVDIAIKCLHNQPKLRPTMAEVVVGLESALALQEKSTYYILQEIMPPDYATQEDEDSSTLEVKNTNHKREHEFAGGEVVNVSKDWHHDKQSFPRMKFTKRLSGLLSVTARVFSGYVSGNRPAKTSKYRTGILSVVRNKFRSVNTKTFVPVYPAMPPPPRRETQFLQSLELKCFTFNDLEKATRAFRPDSILGEGGFGRVYKGWIDENTFAAANPGSGLVVAVKRLNSEGLQGHREWLAEINYLGSLCHPNLTKLIGYCVEDDHRLIVYEFMPKGSLENHLFRRGPHIQPLSWNIRLRIALDAAKGLAYLHSPEARVIYRDFKTSNILLDSEYNAKLSDFGLAKDQPQHDTHVSTRVMGTYGYAAPEYVATGHLSTKSDVYGFGVVLLEILTGRRVINKNLPQPQHNLVDWAKPYLTSKDKVLHVMDAKIKGQYTVSAALGVSSLAFKCLCTEPRFRPDANQVVIALEEQILNLKLSKRRPRKGL
ncbi:hypothetical protein DCAR_0102497 [Daucus carota subsp. sativus]|uniref:non-specific serine/threonine protein kinase n=1 Tax=Daucus carota subsp. sativus TaxID=79200 RepID=A0AAF0W5C8_DAUCS|nr:PREDICTED: uncharacterized protein LOC108225633 [Daucus carota subsp. sativus]WOG83322.1 hypothetical protein DCAR_0102497 [Daucus carota subsp. sativus]